MKKLLLFLLPVVLTMLACKDARPQADIDEDKIKDYLKAHNITAQRDDYSRIYYVIQTPGSGNNPNATSYVKVKYKGYFLDGTVFDQTDGDETYESLLQNFISGWQIAVPLLKPGGKGTFYIPSVWAYGRYGNGSIPPNEVLVFDIELISFR